MGIYIEALILFILLFFSVQAGVFAGLTAPAGAFEVTELAKIFLYYLPCLALIWYLLLKVHKVKIQVFRFEKKDLISGFITFPGLLLIGLGVTFLSIKIGAASAQISLYSPSSVPGWIQLCFTCIFSAYLEESFFRYYLLSQKEKFGLGSASALVLSVVLFSSIHFNAGPWSILNSALCGTFLGLVFLRYKTLHGIAIAHSLYNICAFILNTMIN